jgi:hypothetical protein
VLAVHLLSLNLPTFFDTVRAVRRYVGSCPAEMAALEKALAESAAREQFLDGYEFDVPEEDFRLMMGAREWPKKLVAVLEVHVAKIEDEHERFENALKARRAEFLELLQR